MLLREDEYAPHHRRYIDLVSGPVLDVLQAQRETIARLPRVIAEESAGYRYAPGKWSMREVIGHMSDAERVYGYRALALARGDANPLPKYDPDGYVAAADFDTRSVASLTDELLALRESTLTFFRNLPEEAWSRRGTMGGQPLSVRALAYIAAGHVEQHLNVLYERYGVAR